MKEKPHLAMAFDYLNHVRERMDDLHDLLSGLDEDAKPNVLNCIMGDLAEAGMAIESIHDNMSRNVCPACGNYTNDDED